jgi:transcription antitermination factor NusG
MDGMIGIAAPIEPVAASPSSLRWYALQTHPAREYRVRRWLAAGEVDPEDSPRRLVPMVARDFRSKHGLDRVGYEMWLPECVIVSVLRRIVIRKKGPWFPGYLFVRLDLARHDWRAFDDVDGIAGLLLDSGRPRAIADERIAGLRAACDATGGVAVIAVASPREFRKGQQVRIAQGICAGYAALFVRSIPTRNTALVDLLCNGMPMEVAEAQLEAVS